MTVSLEVLKAMEQRESVKQMTMEDLSSRMNRIAAQFETIKLDSLMIAQGMKNEINDHINAKVTEVAHEVFRSSVSTTEKQLKPIMERIDFFEIRLRNFNRLLVKNEFHELLEELIELQAKFKKKAVAIVQKHALEGKPKKGKEHGRERSESEEGAGE